MKKSIISILIWLFCQSTFAAIDLNTANQSDLESLSGIGPSKAQAIIDYRKAHGGFETVDELVKVDGIGPGTLKRLSKDVKVRSIIKEIKPKGRIPSSVKLDQP